MTTGELYAHVGRAVALMGLLVVLALVGRSLTGCAKIQTAAGPATVHFPMQARIDPSGTLSIEPNERATEILAEAAVGVINTAGPEAAARVAEVFAKRIDESPKP